jgi:DNA processing protein
MLLDYFGNAQDAWNAPEEALRQTGIGKSAAAKIIEFRKTFSPERYVERMQKQQAAFLILEEPSYPQLLQQTERPPFVLYIKGNKDLLSSDNDENRLAVVGTRKITEYGKHVTETLASELANAGLIIVSGLALGVDAVAHSGTLDAGGRTIAVLGSGVDVCTPRENCRHALREISLHLFPPLTLSYKKNSFRSLFE